MVDIHRHSEFSMYDGFGRHVDLVKCAMELGHTALSNTDHGNTNGLVHLNNACKKHDFKAILGVEGYFLPKHIPQNRGYHLCLLAKDLEGYHNMNKLQFEGDKQKYYNPIWDFRLLQKYHKGLICTTACVAGYLARSIMANKKEQAVRFLQKMVEIFGDDFYIEIQPYKVSDPGMQEKVNKASIKLAKQLGIKCILTSDSHFGYKDDFETYLLMHEMAKHDLTMIEKTYRERYMPSEEEIVKRFERMHKNDFNDYHALGEQMIANIEEISDKCEKDYLSKLQFSLPTFSDEPGLLVKQVKQGLKDRGLYKPEYIKRCQEELAVIKHHGFENYFLMVADYVNWAKAQGIAVGPGRGSVCNCLVAYALKITEVDSLKFGLLFMRFLRMDKAKHPDIDVDFQTSRRGEVIDYICKKYEGKAARICSYGLYKCDNLVNDLAPVCGLTGNTGDIAAIKAGLNKHIPFFGNEFLEGLDVEKIIDDIKSDRNLDRYNQKYNNIIDHFCKLFLKVKYVGTHAAGVAIVDGDILQYVALRTDAKTGDIYTNYDLTDLHDINVMKFDVLGLKTMESIADLRNETGDIVDYAKVVDDEQVIQAFQEGNCDGVFQFEKPTPRDILKSINADSFDDVTATTAMNRPGPLKIKMPAAYAENKFEGANHDSPYYKYVEKTHGTIVYQEQIQRICINIGEVNADDTDQVIRAPYQLPLEELRKDERWGPVLKDFVKGCTKHKIPKEESEALFENFFNSYSFNEGHATGYTLISFEEMYYKIYHSAEYWYAKMKYAADDAQRGKFEASSVKDGVVIFLPHVNFTAEYSMRMEGGEKVIQKGLISIKGVGQKAVDFIEKERKKNGVYRSLDDFIDRCKVKYSPVNKGVIEKLVTEGAAIFDRKVFEARVIKYNASLYGRAGNGY